MSTTKYFVGFTRRIDKVQISRETESSVWSTSGRRHPKRSHSGCYYDSYKEAYEAQRDAMLKDIEHAKSRVRYMEENMREWMDKHPSPDAPP